VMKFVEYVKISDEECRCVDAQLEALQSRLEAILEECKTKYYRDFIERRQDSDDEDYDGEYVGPLHAWSLAVLEEALMATRLSEWSRKHALRFQDLETGQQHIIKPFAPRSSNVVIDVFDIQQTGYHFQVAFDTNKKKTLLAEFSKAQREQWQDYAASTLQRAWKKAYYNPQYEVCQRRLRREHNEMSESPLNKKQRQ